MGEIDYMCTKPGLVLWLKSDLVKQNSFNLANLTKRNYPTFQKLSVEWRNIYNTLAEMKFTILAI